MTPEQKAWAIINLVLIGVMLVLLWSWIIDAFFDWIGRRFIEPWKERIRRGEDQ